MTSYRKSLMNLGLKLARLKPQLLPVLNWSHRLSTILCWLGLLN